MIIYEKIEEYSCCEECTISEIIIYELYHAFQQFDIDLAYSGSRDYLETYKFNNFNVGYFVRHDEFVLELYYKDELLYESCYSIYDNFDPTLEVYNMLNNATEQMKQEKMGDIVLRLMAYSCKI
jgi:hypothetical protein